METELIDCASEIVDRDSVTMCEAVQQIGALLRLDLHFPTFDMTFEFSMTESTRSAGSNVIRSTSTSRFATSGSSSSATPFSTSRGSGDPIWSRQNGERMAQLVEDFLTDHG